MSTAASLSPSAQITTVQGGGYLRKARRYIESLIIALMASPCGTALAQTVGPPSVIPDAMTVDVPTTITVTAAISGNVIPQSVEVQRLDSLGNPIAIIGKLSDNGVSPDLVAGDGVYTGAVSISNSSIGKVALRVSAAALGSLRRTVSAPASIDVVPTGFPTTYVPIPNAPTATDPNTGATIIANEVLACFAPGTSVSTIVSTARLISGTVFGRIYGGRPNGDACYQILLPVSSATAVNNAIQSLEAQPSVTVVDADMITQLQADACLPPPPPTGNTKSYNNIQLDAAQKISTGQGVKVAVLDTGVDIYNSDLSPHIVKVIDGADDFGHGTNVIGIVAAVAPQASILSIKVCGPASEGCPEARQRVGLNKAMAEMAAMGPMQAPIAANGCPATPPGPGGVINMSLGGVTPRPRVAELITCAISQNIVVVASAGNERNPALLTALHYPAADSGVISVGNVDETDVRNPCSVHGGWVKMSAPGVNIKSAGCFNWKGPPVNTCGPIPTTRFIIQLVRLQARLKPAHL